jgi:hypothetical protein
MVRTGAALSVTFRSNPAAIRGATLQTKAVERQIAVVTIIAVKIGAFLAAVAADVRRIKIQDNLGTLAGNSFDSTFFDGLKLIAGG